MQEKEKASAWFNPKVYAVAVCCVVVVFLLITVVHLPPSPSLAPAQPGAPLRTIPDTDINPYGGNFFLDWEVEPWKIDKTLQMAQEAGLGWANVHFVWEGLETKKGHYWDDRLNKSTWDKYDYIVQVAAKYGIQVIARLDRPPAWTRVDNTRPERPPDNFNDYGDFVEAVATRYKGHISYYQIWNEPNIFPEWGNQPVDPAGYVRLLKVAYERIKKVDANARVMSAPLAQTTESGSNNLDEFDYLEAMYRAGAKDYFDVLSANGYGFDAPPEDPPAPNKLNFQRVLLLRQVMERNGDGDTAIWFHEFGWNASPESMDSSKLQWQRVSEQDQADYTVRAIKMARSNWPWAGVFSIWYFRQDGHITPDQSEYYFRMVDPGFTPRIIYYAVAAAAKDAVVAGPGQYQETNPGLTIDSGWTEERNQQASGGALLTADQAGASVTIRFKGTEFSLLTMTGPLESQLSVTVDGSAANLLPSSGEGRSYINLASAQPRFQVDVPVASGLSYGQHVARIVVGPAGSEGTQHAVIDGFQVVARTTIAWAVYLVSGVVAAIGLLAVIILRRRTRGGRGSVA